MMIHDVYLDHNLECFSIDIYRTYIDITYLQVTKAMSLTPEL